MKFTSTYITVENIEVYAYHGVMDQERKVGNEFLVSVTLDFNAEEAMRSDDINLTVNYAEVVRVVRDVMLEPSLLIENVTYRIIMALKEAFPTITGGFVTVTKPHPPFSTPSSGASFSATFKC